MRMVCSSGEHDPEKWKPVFRKDSCSKQRDEIMMRFLQIAS
jgi:hypothetical protein